MRPAFKSLLLFVSIIFVSIISGSIIGGSDPRAAGSNPLDTLQPGQWYEVPNSKLALLDPCPQGNCTYSGFTGFPAIMSAWSGGAYDTTRDRLLIWGGGHGDYGGNQVYAFSVNTMSWSRIWGPSPNIPAATSCPCEPLSDGNPSSRHTYDGLEYLPKLDQLFSTGGSLWSGSGGGTNTTWTFSLGTSQWQKKSNVPASQVAALSAYDPTTGHIYALPTNGTIYEYNPVSNTWSPRGGPGGWSEYDPARTMVYHPTQKKLLIIGGGVVSLYDMTQLQPTEQRLSTTGGSAVVNVQGPGLAYDPIIDRIVAWPGGGADVYSLDLATRVWTRHAPANTVVPPPLTSKGTYGRWQYIPSKNAYVGVDSVNSNVFFYKLTNSTATPPPAGVDTTAPSAPSNVTASGVSVSQINLSWSASTDNVGVSGYQVERCQGSGCIAFTQIGTTSGNSYSDTGLGANTIYRYRVRATDATGNLSSYSSIAQATTQSIISTPPSGAPYPTSSVITGINFNWSTHIRRASGSDNWPITWADDDNQYTSWGDGGGFGGADAGLGVARISGTAINYTGTNLWSVPRGTAGGKSYGLISVDGVLYMWVSPGSDTESYTEARLYRSTDHGSSWTKATWAFTQSQGLIFPTFLQFGKDYQGARDSYIYVYANHLKSSAELSVQKPGEIALLRVPKASIMERNSYEFFAGLDGSGNPTWTTNLAYRRSVFTDSRGVGWNTSASFNPGLGRYLLITEHDSTVGGNIGIFDAPNPWGPWSTVLYTSAFGSPNITSDTFFWNFSNKWLSADGKNFTLIFTGTGENDSWNTVQGSFTTSSVAPTPTPDTTAPSMPGNLTASAISASQINLSWTASTDNVGVTGYRLERCQGTACTTFTQIGTPTGTSYSDTGLTTNATYRYRLRSQDSAGNLSPYSPIVNVTTPAIVPPTDTVAPSTPVGLTATAVSSAQINLSWTASTDNVGVAAYRIERCQGTACTTFVQIGTPAVTAYSDSALVSNTAYRYRVRAADASGNLSPYSSISQATTQTVSPTWPPATALNIPDNGWISILNPPDGSKGPYSGTEFGGGKHSRLLFDSKRNRLVLTGGDYNHPFGEANNGNQMVWSIDLAKGSAWALLGPWCNGPVQPGRPDNVIWAYDSKRDRGIVMPGFYFIYQQDGSGCVGTTDSGDSMSFNFATNKWDLPQWSAPAGGYGGDNGSTFGVYDPVSDSVYRFRYSGNARIERLNLATNQWTEQALGITNADMHPDQPAIDVQGRAVYIINRPTRQLLKYNIDSKTVVFDTHLPAQWKPPVSEFGGLDQETYMVFDPNNRVILIPNTTGNDGVIHGLGVYRVDSKQWEWKTVPAGANGNTFGFDPVNNAMLSMGARDQSGKFWLYRYANLSSPSVPGDTTAPSAPSGLTVTAGSSSQISLSWSASTDNVAVTGYPIERCSGSTCTNFAQFATSSGTSHLDTGLTANTTYRYKVRAVDAAGNLSTYSAIASATTQSSSTPPPPTGNIINATPSNYTTLLPGLKPGDTIVLAGGNYLGMSVNNLNGTAIAPITITGPSSGSPAVVLGSAGENTLRIQDSSYVVIKNLEVNPRNLGGDGVNGESRSHHITLDNLYIHGCSDDQQTVGISTNRDVVWNWVIKNTTITDCGTGMYLGDSDGNQQFLSGLIENNLIYDTIGYNIEFKQQNPLPTNISGLPVTTTKTIIRNNVFSKAKNASTGANARPNLLVGHMPLTGAGQDNYYEIYGNFFYQNPTGEPLFQGEGNYAFYNNVLFNSLQPAGASATILAQPHNDKPRNVRIFNNTVVAPLAGISVSGGYTSFRQQVIGNAIFSANPIAASDQQDNITSTYANASTYLNNPFGALGTADFYPKIGRLTGAAINTSTFNSYTDWDKDFNGSQRAGFTFRGAYFGEGTNPGWLPKLQEKPAGIGLPPSIPAAPTNLQLQ